MPMVSSTEGSPTKTCWKRRSRAGSFSMCSRYSSSVVAPTMRSSPRASIGLIMLPASIAESPVAPAPTMVCSSSMKVITCPSASVISCSTALSRSSNSPRYLAPATIEPRSSAIRRLPFRLSGTSPATIRWASPSTIAVLPTPGSPISTGLFLVRRDSTCTTRRISVSRPMTGSIFPSRARSVRSTAYFSSAWKVFSGSGLVTLGWPGGVGKGASSASGVAPALARRAPASPSVVASPTSRCSVETYSSPSALACSPAALIARSSSRDGEGAATVEPLTLGSRRSAASALARTSAGSAPVACSRGPAMPSVCSSSATSRCTGSSAAWPRSTASRWAAAIASCERVVSLLCMVGAGVLSCVPGGCDWSNGAGVESVPLNPRRPVRRSTASERDDSAARNSHRTGDTADVRRVAPYSCLMTDTPSPSVALDDQLCFALYAASRAVTARYRPMLDQLGVTYPQYLVLMLLWEEDGQTVGQLGQRLALDSGTLSPLLKRLTSAGLVTRHRRADDERSVSVRLTDAGRALEGPACAISAQMIDALALDKSEFSELKGRLRMIPDRVSEPRTDAAAR